MAEVNGNLMEELKEERRSWKMDDFERLKFLGKGGFGKVHLVRRKQDSQIFAMKSIAKPKNNKERDQLIEEKSILEQVDHPFIVKMVDCFKTRTKYCFVMEFLPGGTMEYLLDREEKLTEPDAKFYLGELTLALEYLHNNQIIYRDLKLENILLTIHGHIKLVDFGLSLSNFPTGSLTKGFRGTLSYMAPEIVSKKEYDHSVDIWSLGVFMFTVLTGHFPFDGEDNKEKIINILTHRLRLPSGLSKEGKLLLKSLLVRKVVNRASIQSIKQSAFFEEMDWDQLAALQIDPPFKPDLMDATDPSLFTSVDTADSFIEINHFVMM